MGENLHSLIQKSKVIGYLRKISGFNNLPFFKLEWMAEAFQKVKFNNVHEIVYDCYNNSAQFEQSLFILHKGSIEVTYEKSQAQTLQEAGSYFGESFFITSDPQPSFI